MSQLPPGANAQPSLTTPVFPSQSFPAETRHARLLGIYPQRQPGKFMQRVRIPGGILSADQWRTLAQVVRRFTPATPLHLTTRQDLELHDLSESDIPGVHQLLAGAGLTSLGSGGDTLRNIVVCPCSAGGANDSPNLLPLGQAIAKALAAYEGLFTLPRKFKISLGSGQGSRPFVHDLAFVAVQRNARWGLKVFGAGSLGAKPGLGIVLLDWIEPTDALPLSLAAVRLFAKHGDRQNRAKARLRHVRERLGNEAFLAELMQEFKAAKTERAWPAIELSLADSANLAKRTLAFPNGDITAEAADALACLAEHPGVSVRIGNDHRVFVFTTGAADALFLATALTAASQSQAHVIACPGTRWCSRGLADTNGLAGRIRTALAGTPGGELNIAISGCPNGCTANAVADIGLFGGKSTVDGQTVEKFILVSGGGKGATDVLARTVAAGLSADQAVAEVARLADTLANG